MRIMADIIPAKKQSNIFTKKIYLEFFTRLKIMGLKITIKTKLIVFREVFNRFLISYR